MRLHKGNAAGFNNHRTIWTAVYAYGVLSSIVTTSAPSSSLQRPPLCGLRIKDSLFVQAEKLLTRFSEQVSPTAADQGTVTAVRLE